jgi:catechol 2,3-dioxygenase-like lactoylglutathione lyase family enzyme
MTSLRINHVSVSSPDQDASSRFYTELFGAERIPAPNFGFRVDWFALGDTQLHIFPEDGQAAPRRHHLGITVDDILPVYRRARELGVIDPVFTDCVRVLEDGAVQFYLRDPGGNLIEVNGLVGDYTTEDIPELKHLTDLHPQGPENAGARLFL